MPRTGCPRYWTSSRVPPWSGTPARPSDLPAAAAPAAEADPIPSARRTEAVDHGPRRSAQLRIAVRLIAAVPGIAAPRSEPRRSAPRTNLVRVAAGGAPKSVLHPSRAAKPAIATEIRQSAPPAVDAAVAARSVRPSARSEVVKTVRTVVQQSARVAAVRIGRPVVRRSAPAGVVRVVRPLVRAVRPSELASVPPRAMPPRPRPPPQTTNCRSVGAVADVRTKSPVAPKRWPPKPQSKRPPWVPGTWTTAGLPSRSLSSDRPDDGVPTLLPHPLPRRK